MCQDMLPIILLVLGSSTISLQEPTTGGTDPTTFTTVQFTDDTFPTTLNLPQTIFPQKVHKTRIDASSCKNQFLCNLQKKSTLSKGFPPVPSKNLVPPFTELEEEELKTTEETKTTLFDSETETAPLTTLIFKAPSFKSSITPIIVQKRDNPVGPSKAEATNELRSYLPPVKLSPAPAQIDLSYLPPQGVLPAAAAASLDISRVNFQPPLEESPAAAQNDARQLKPNTPQKDICSDAFHSFLCTPLKSRKRITGALPNSLIPNPAFSPAPSNTVQNSVSPASPKQTYLPSSTTLRPSPTPTTTAYAPLPSNVDRSYLPPAPKPFDASPSFNSVRVAHAKETSTATTTTRKPFTSTPRPFIQTSIIPFIAPKVIEQINLLPSTTTRRPTTTTTTTPRPTTTTTPRSTTTTRRPTTTPAVSLYPEPSNEINRGYLPPATTTKRPFIELSAALPTFRQKSKPPSVQIITDATKRVPTTTSRYSPAPSNADRNYLPPEPTFQSAAAAQAGNRALPPIGRAPPSPSPVAAAQHEHHEHHDHHDHHHGRDICTDPFHSFLCAPLKQRKRITGALPPGFNPQSSNRKETRLRPDLSPKPETSLSPENTYQSETRVKPAEEVPAANALIPLSVGYQYPKPTPGFPLPSQTATDFVRPTPPRPTPPRPTPPRPTPPRPTPPRPTPPRPTPPRPTPPRPTPPRPTSPRPTTVRPTTLVPTAVTGYNYLRPSNPFPLPSQQNVEVIPKEDRLSPTFASPQGYQYPKPNIPFPLPSQQQQQRLPSTVSRPLSPQPSSTPIPKTFRPNLITTTAKPLQPQPSDQRTGYQYPKPAQSLPLPNGYRYPKPSNPLLLPVDVRSDPTLSPSTSLHLGSADFIPVNKIDAKRQVSETGSPKGSPRFGERIRSRVRQLGIARIF